MKLGARMIKTGVSITLALWIAILLKLDPPTYAAIAAIAAIQPSIYKSYQSIVSNLRGSIIGAVVAIIFFYTIGNNPFVIGLVVVIVMAVQMKFKTHTSITLPAVTVIAIMAGTPTGYFLVYALKRFSLALIGVGSSFLVNLIFGPPKFETRLFQQVLYNSEEIIKSLRLKARYETADSVLKEDMVKFRENRLEAEQLFSLYKEERTFLPSRRFAKGRKLVVFRQMIQSNQLALEVLKSMHRHENEFRRVPHNLQKYVQNQLEHLINYHEQIFMKFSGKTRSDLPNRLTDQVIENQKSLSKAFLSFYEKDGGNYEQWLHLFPTIALIIDYHEHLLYLDKLINGFQTFHQKENHIELNTNKTLG
ncbi:MAG TPA: aromatic acid exporter family protein [Bacillales bacterium]|nr:aromatic acid exporter family protein [Bacillales bacterium]